MIEGQLWLRLRRIFWTISARHIGHSCSELAQFVQQQTWPQFRNSVTDCKIKETWNPSGDCSFTSASMQTTHSEFKPRAVISAGGAVGVATEGAEGVRAELLLGPAIGEGGLTRHWQGIKLNIIYGYSIKPPFLNRSDREVFWQPLLRLFSRDKTIYSSIALFAGQLHARQSIKSI